MTDLLRVLATRSTMFTLLLTAVALVTAACGDSTGPEDSGDSGDPGGGPAASVVIEPGALLLTSAGETMQLEATVYDASGDPVEADVSWQSTDPGVISVSADGVATAAAALGSAQITAMADGVTSDPALAVVAQPAPSVLLVPDSLILSDPEAVDPDADYGPGWSYRIRVREITPAIGQIVVGKGGRPLAGRVTGTSPAGGDTELTVELVPLKTLFQDLRIDEQLPLVETESGSGGSSWRATDDFGRSEFEPSGMGAVQADTSFKIGRFDCKASGETPDLDLPDPSYNINPNLSLDLGYNNGLERLIVIGSVNADFSYKPVVKLEFEGKVGCETVLTTVTVPLTGFLSWFVGVQVPIGIGVDLEGKLEVGEVGFKVSATARATSELGMLCPSGGGTCTGVTDFHIPQPDFDFELITPNLADEFKIELGAHGFLFAKPSVGSRWSSATQFEFLEAKAGLKQSVDLATAKRQASEDNYASGFALAGLVEVGPGEDLQNAIDRLGEWIGDDLDLDLTLVDVNDTLAVSPKGTFTITPASVAPGDSSALGDMATFTIDLDPVTYLGLDAVESVEIFWKKDDGSGGFTLEPGRPGCTDITASSGQMQFTCQTDFLREHSGLQTFYAFVHAKMFGLTVPFALEVADDGSAIVTVASADCPASSGAFDIYSEASGQYGDGESEVVVAQFDHVHVTASADGGDAGSDGASWYAEATTADEIHLSPADTSRIGEFVTVDIHVRGEVSLSGTENPENGRAGAVAGFRYENERREWKLSEQNQGSIVIDETVTATAELGNWQFIGMSVIASLVPWPEDMYDASVQLRIVSVDNVRDLQGNPVPVTAFCAASGTDYNATAGSNIVIR